MKVLFRATKELSHYEGFEKNSLMKRAKDGQVIEVSDEMAARLLKDFKANFSKVSEAEAKKALAKEKKEIAEVVEGHKKDNDAELRLSAAEKAVAEAEAKMKAAKLKADNADNKRKGIMSAQYGKAKKAYEKAVADRDKIKAAILAA